jgi:serine/alanine adding enzyme
MHIEVDEVAPAGWDEYVNVHAARTAYHLSAPAAIGARVFGLRTAYVSARNGARLTGILPLVQQSSILFGRFLVSVPFFTYGGILADDADTAVALARRAGELAHAWQGDYVELRHTAPIAGLTLAERLDKVSMMLALPGTEGELAKQLGSKLRSQIRRADREQAGVVWGGRELIPEFYRVFAASMHALGTPVYPLRFFEQACAAFQDLGAVLVVRVGGKVQAAAFVVRHGSRIEVPWAAATPAAKSGAVNMKMYWEMLRFAIDRGAETFDFGRSTIDSGTYRFKAQWGAVPHQLHWHYWLPAGATIPKLNNSNPKYALASALWKRLPLWSANLLGPQIARHLP